MSTDNQNDPAMVPVAPQKQSIPKPLANPTAKLPIGELPPPPPPIPYSILLAKAKEAENENLTNADIRVRIVQALRARLVKPLGAPVGRIPLPPKPHGQSLPSRPPMVPYSVLLERADEASKKNIGAEHIETKIIQAMKARFTKKVTKIQPLKNPTAPPPIGELPSPPASLSKMDYSKMLEAAKLCTAENRVSDDIRIKIVQGLRDRLIKPLGAPIAKPPTKIPPPPKPISYAEMLRKAKECEVKGSTTDDIRVRIVQGLRARLIKPLGAPSSIPKPPIVAQMATKYANLPKVNAFTWKMANKKLARVEYTKLQKVDGLTKANELIDQLNKIIDTLNNDLKSTSQKINAKILQESGLWDVPNSNIKHAFLGSLVCYSMDPTLTPQALQSQIQIHPNQFPYTTFNGIQDQKYNSIFNLVLDWIKIYASVETALPKLIGELEEIPHKAKDLIQKGRDLFTDVDNKKKSKLVPLNASLCRQIEEVSQEILQDVNTDFESMKEALELVSQDVNEGMLQRKAKCKKIKVLNPLSCYETAYGSIRLESQRKSIRTAPGNMQKEPQGCCTTF